MREKDGERMGGERGEREGSALCVALQQPSSTAHKGTWGLGAVPSTGLGAGACEVVTLCILRHAEKVLHLVDLRSACGYPQLVPFSHIWFTVRYYWMLLRSFIERVNSNKITLPSLQIVTLCILRDDKKVLHLVDMRSACE